MTLLPQFDIPNGFRFLSISLAVIGLSTSFSMKKDTKHFLCFQVKYRCWQCLLTNLLKILYSLNYVKQCHHNRIYRSTAIASAAIDWEQKIELLPAQVCHTLFTQQWDFFFKETSYSVCALFLLMFLGTYFWLLLEFQHEKWQI